MSNSILCHHEGVFFTWSSVMDAATSPAMSREEVEDYYGELSPEGRASWLASIEHAVEHGTALSGSVSLESLIEHNRAGPDEEHLTLDEVLERVEAFREGSLPVRYPFMAGP